MIAALKKFKVVLDGRTVYANDVEVEINTPPVYLLKWSNTSDLFYQGGDCWTTDRTQAWELKTQEEVDDARDLARDSAKKSYHKLVVA